MSYGIKVINANNRVVLNSEEGSPMLVPQREGTWTSTNNRHGVGSGYVGSRIITYASRASNPTLLYSDTILATRSSSGYLSHDVRSGLSGSANSGIFATPGSGKWMQVKGVNASGISNHNTGYGLNVFDGTGTAASDLLFSTNASSSLQIVSIGNFTPPTGSANYYKDVVINSSEEHWILLSTSAFWMQDIVLPSGGGTFREQLASYEYRYTGTTSNLETIRIHSALYNWGGGSSNAVITRREEDNRIYIIFKKRS